MMIKVHPLCIAYRYSWSVVLREADGWLHGGTHLYPHMTKLGLDGMLAMHGGVPNRTQDVLVSVLSLAYTVSRTVHATELENA